MTDDELKTLIDRLANTLQATLLLAARLEADLRQSAPSRKNPTGVGSISGREGRRLAAELASLPGPWLA